MNNIRKRLLALLLTALLLGLPQALAIPAFAAPGSPGEEQFFYEEPNQFVHIYERAKGLASQGGAEDLGDLMVPVWAVRSSASVNIRPLDLIDTPANRALLLQLYQEAVYNNQDVAFDVRTGYSYSIYDGYLSSLSPIYAAGDRETMRAAIDAAANRMLATVPPEATELDKVLAVNDFLALHCEYDPAVLGGASGAEASYTAYGCLGLGVAVCQGYTMAASYLFRLLGVESFYVNSVDMNHAWNLAKVDGSWYHLDITWNDATPDKLGQVRHSNFLRSAAGITTTQHHDWDSGVPAATSTKYDSFFWTYASCVSAMIPRGAQWLYSSFVSGNRALRGAAKPGGSPLTDVLPMGYTGGWKADAGSSIWQLAPYLGRYGDKLFYNTPTGLRYIDLNAMSDNAFPAYAPALTGLQCVYEMRIEGDYAHVRVATLENTFPQTYTVLQNTLVPLAPGAISVTGLVVPAQKEYAVVVGAALQIGGVSVTPANATNQALRWNAVDTGIAAVSSGGLVTGVAPGVTYVVVMTDNGAYAQRFKITVNAPPVPIPVTNVMVSPKPVSLQVGGTQTLTATITPSNADNPGVTWSSSNPSVATVDASGLVTAIAVGTATITATSDDNASIKDTCIVTVSAVPVPVVGVTVSPKPVSLQVGGTQTLTATVTPTNADNPAVTWSSSNPSVATVDASGLVTAIAVGTATITATSNENASIKDTCIVTVTAVPVPVVGVTVSPKPVSLQVGGTQTLTATVTPSNADNPGVTWSSSNPSVATVNASGLVTAIAVGTATITATSAADITKQNTCVVTVTAPPAPLPAKITLQLNQNCASFTEKSAAGIEWSSSNTKALKIDKDSGKVSYNHRPGTAVVEGKQLVGGQWVTVYKSEVQVKYSFWQWLAAIFLLGFLWL